jgi:hypothetical protein
MRQVGWIAAVAVLAVGAMLGLRLLFGAEALLEMLMGPG